MRVGWIVKGLQEEKEGLHGGLRRRECRRLTGRLLENIN